MQNNLALDGGADLRTWRSKPFVEAAGYALRDDEIIIDSFAGAGGMSMGIEEALGRSPDVAINHWDAAIGTHEHNHPETRHFHASVYAVDPRDMVPRGKSVGLLWASPDCFTAGTLVYAERGLTPIEDIEVGENVLTHKGRWRAVTKRWSQTSDTVEVSGHGHYGIVTTPGHAFYSKRITTQYPSVDKSTGKRPGEKRTLVENPYWPEASDMKGKLWATPQRFPSGAIPICPAVQYDDGFFYFLGRWLGDGSLNKGDVEICGSLVEAPLMEAYFVQTPLCDAEGDVIEYRTVNRISTIAFVWGCAPLTRWLEQEAGRLCEDKRLPLWCLGMQKSWRAALLQGYLDADGNRNKRMTRAKSVSKQLALGMRLLATSLGKAVSLYKYEGGPGEIEGRQFVARDCYEISWTETPERKTTFTDTLHRYSPVREVKPAGERLVYCLQVEEDESFVADGIVVHNCREFSRAKNGAPRSPSVRMLASCVVHYAEMIKPRVIGMENVVEFESAGPLDENGKIIKERKGEIFQAWIAALVALGYDVEWQTINAADFGAPTLRHRFFLQARLDGLPIVWPAPTHGAPDSEGVRTGRLKPWHTAADCLEFDRPVNSIFLDREEARKRRCKRPLADKTERRIARGLFRHVINNPKPFIVTYYGERRPNEGFRGSSLDEPFSTATAGGNRFGLVVPLTHGGDNRVYGQNEPFRTITGAHRGELAYVAPTMVQTGYGEREGQAPRSLDIERPIGTIVAGGGKHAVVAAHLTCFNQNAAGNTPDEPLKTVMAGATRHAYVAGQLSGGVDRSEQVAEFLWKYRHLSERPVTRDDLGVVHVDGVPMRMTDIGLRMLAHTELAAAQGFRVRAGGPGAGRPFDPSMRADGTVNTGEEIVKMIGNSVSPPAGAAVIRAMFGIDHPEMALAA